MPRARKIHVQTALVFHRRGGKRRGAGRPRSPDRTRSSERHETRPRLKPNHPVHVTVRIERDLGTLRDGHKYKAFRRALTRVLGRDTFRIVHLSLQRGHAHLLVEASNERELARGMQAFEISAARYLNQASTRRGRPRMGRVFSDRYHARAITTPRAARHALAYVINNWRRHAQDGGMDAMFHPVDPYSSGPSFTGWREREALRYRDELPADYVPLPTSRPQTWLLNSGWLKHGLISTREVPGPAAHRLVA